MQKPTVDFYISKLAGQQAWLFICQLIEQQYMQTKQVYIHVNSLDEAERLDKLLWTFREDSFIPHNLYHPTDTSPPPIQIGFQQHPAQHQDVLMNLNQDIPTFYLQFNQVMEIVFSDPPMQELARKRYKQYREQGCELRMYQHDHPRKDL